MFTGQFSSESRVPAWAGACWQCQEELPRCLCRCGHLPALVAPAASTDVSVLRLHTPAGSVALTLLPGTLPSISSHAGQAGCTEAGAVHPRAFSCHGNPRSPSPR